MTFRDRYLSPAEAARKLGVSIKTLRLYEQRALIMPTRTEAGWRCYSPADMETASQIVALRNLGLSLAQVEQVLNGDFSSFAAALASHRQDLLMKIDELQIKVHAVGDLLATASSGELSGLDDLPQFMRPTPSSIASFELPWPWGGETFHIERPAQLNFIIGPLASGKTRFAKRIAEVLPDADFLGLDRADGDGPDGWALRDDDKDLEVRVETALNWFAGEGADVNDALMALVARLEADNPSILVIDLIEHGLTAATQSALGRYLRMQNSCPRPLYIMTRSSSILDLEHVGSKERIILCPPNQSPPIYVAPFQGAIGFETVALCLASPDVRERMEGVIAVHSAGAA